MHGGPDAHGDEGARRGGRGTDGAGEVTPSTCSPQRGAALAACTAIALAAACQPAVDAQETLVSLVPSAESTAPLSESYRIAVTPEGIACVIDSYEVRIHCVDRDDRVIGSFGREGDGPGEFLGPTSIDRAPDGGIVVTDMERARLLWFRPTGELLSESKAPSVFIVAGSNAGSLLGMTMISFENVEVDIASGDILWSRTYPPPDGLDAPDCEAGGVARPGFGFPTPRGGMLFRPCQGQLLVRYADRDDDAPAETAVVPTYRSTLPQPADIESYMRGLTRLASGVAPAESDVEGFRNTPRPWHTSRVRFDGRGRTWMATRGGVGDFSHIDVHDGVAYLGTVRVRHSLIGMDIAGSVLAVLVDRPVRSDDPAGIPRRGIDWYDIGDVEFPDAVAH